MSENETNKAGRSRKKRMYNNFENTEDIGEETKSEQESDHYSHQEENIREVGPENMVIELVEELKFKGSLLTPEQQKNYKP